MSGITQSAAAVGQRVVGEDRRARIIALGLVTALSAILIVLVLALGGSFSGSDGNEAAAPATQQPATASPEPGVRYDGGPEEGTSGAAIASRNRYDGGPEEGTRGPNR